MKSPLISGAGQWLRALLLLLAGLTLIAPARGQGWLGIANSNYAGTHALYFNPARIADSRELLYVNLAAADLNFYNTYLTLDMPYTPWQVMRGTVPDQYRDSRGNVVFRDSYLKEQLDGNTKFGSVSAEVRLPSFMIGFNSGKSVALSNRVRTFVQANNVSEPVALLARHGLDQADLFGLARRLLADNSFNVSVNAYHETALTFAGPLNLPGRHFFKGGLTVKYLAGLGSTFVNNLGLRYQIYSGDSLQLLDRRVSYGYADYRYYDRDDFKVGDLFGARRLGWGAGGDLGISYEFRPDTASYRYQMDGEIRTDHSQNKYRLRVGLALTDIGTLLYDNTQYVSRSSISFNGPAQWGSLDTIKYRNLPGIDRMLQQVVTLNERATNYFVQLPTALNMTADYRLWRCFYLGAAWTQNLLPATTVGSRAISSASLTPRAEFRHAEVALPVILANNYQQLQLGAMLRLGPLLLGSDNLGGVFGATSVSGYDFYAGLNVAVYKKRRKDHDKDFVSDKYDKCPTVKGTWEFRGCPDRDLDHIPDDRDACPTEPGLPQFQGCPDTDEDGIPDKEDECPGAAGPAEFKGCPDQDGDQIPDKDDACPTEAGVAEFRGCPDRDGDHVKDSQDRCPDLAGSVEHQGCPDTDQDSLYDHEDTCPTVAGPVENKGCPWPDTDGDTVLDKDDACVDVAGPVENKGCPWADTDGDGTFDNVDECPRTPGPASNKGCPVLAKKEQQILNLAFANLEFQTGKDVIVRTSYPSLNRLAELLRSRPAYRLRLSGHTDNVGKPAANLLLSKKRALAVQRYLAQRGVPAEQIKAEWFGQTKPKASNKTATGRRRNRRVEMKVLFD